MSQAISLFGIPGFSFDPTPFIESLYKPATDGVLHFFQNFLTIVTSVPPDFTYQLQIHGVNGIFLFWNVFRAVAIALLVLITVIGGLQMMIGRATGVEYIPPGVFIPRVIAAFLACNLSFVFCQMFIELGNSVAKAALAFTAQFAGPGIIVTFLATVIADIVTDGALNIFLLILLIIFLVFFIILFFQACSRLFLINLLIVLSPLGIIAWVLPQTRKWAAFWLNLFIATVMEVVIEVIVLCLVFVITFSSNRLSDLPAQLIIAASGFLFVTRVRALLARMGGAGGHDSLLRNLGAIANIVSSVSIAGATGGVGLTNAARNAGRILGISEQGGGPTGGATRAGGLPPGPQGGSGGGIGGFLGGGPAAGPRGGGGGPAAGPRGGGGGPAAGPRGGGGGPAAGPRGGGGGGGRHKGGGGGGGGGRRKGGGGGGGSRFDASSSGTVTFFPGGGYRPPPGKEVVSTLSRISSGDMDD